MAKKKSNLSQPTLMAMSSPRKMQVDHYAGDQPNPHLRRFVQTHAKPYDPDTDSYQVRAFDQPITTTKVTAIYNMHGYHQGKKPHDAIRQYIRHYTSPGDIVFDPFVGSGGTALAAIMEGRCAVAIDRSPAATFLTKNHCTITDVVKLRQTFDGLLKKIGPELDRLYETRCDRCGGKATTEYTVYSQVFQCPRCLKKFPLFNCVKVDSHTAAGKPKKVNACPHCHEKGQTEVIRSQSEKFGAVPVLVQYRCLSGCKPALSERRHDDQDKQKAAYFKQHDLGKIKALEAEPIPYEVPKGYSMTGFSRYQRDALYYYEVEEVADLFTKRNLQALALIRDACLKLEEPARSIALFALTGVMLGMSRMNRYRPDVTYPTNVLSGMYYIPQVSQEEPVLHHYANKLDRLLKGYEVIGESVENPCVCISTQSSCGLGSIPANSIDYIFTDPPYSDQVQYGELNYVWEAWLGFDTNWHEEEIIVNDVRNKPEAEWAAMMKQAMAECYRVLKPGRWLSLCYHDTSEGTWELVQDIMAEVGFLVDKTDSALFIDTGQKSYNQRTADKTTKRDLVLNFRKPKPGEWLVTQVFIPANVDIPTFQELARQIIRDVLTAHPGATKDRIYDALVSSMMRKGQMEAHDFDGLLKSVAEEVQQGGKQGRWYLKETADQLDRAEQLKEDASAARLEKYMVQYLGQHPEHEGVHYSDLFEQFLPVTDKPRRLLADWLPEYFIKTPSGTWRPPDEAERSDLATLREAGTLRRIKRFANALIEGVPVREKDRPGSDRDLLDWLRQCRRAGLYDQGRALFEKGGLNLDNLSPEEQIEADDNYRICARRGSAEEAKPKRQRRTKQDDDE